MIWKQFEQDSAGRNGPEICFGSILWYCGSGKQALSCHESTMKYSQSRIIALTCFWSPLQTFVSAWEPPNGPLSARGNSRMDLG